MFLPDLFDLRAIEMVYVRYCEIVDDKRFEDLHEVFTSDTVGDYTQALGPGVISPDLASLVASMHANLGPGSNCGSTHHNVTNFRINLEGDVARAKVHYYAVHAGLKAHAGAVYSMWGQYEDELVRTPLGWRVKRRVYRLFLADGPVVTDGRTASD